MANGVLIMTRVITQHFEPHLLVRLLLQRGCKTVVQYKGWFSWGLLDLFLAILKIFKI